MEGKQTVCSKLCQKSYKGFKNITSSLQIKKKLDFNKKRWYIINMPSGGRKKYTDVDTAESL